MAENKKVIISIVVDDKSAKKNLNEVENATKKAGDAAKKADKGFLGLGKTFTAIARGFVIVKSFQLLARAVTESVRVLADFELAMAKVKAITEANEQQFKRLENSAKDLALGTMFTATQVAELQLAYSKLGFTTDEILAATKATTQLATITGDDLANSADVVGSVIRGFNLDAKEAGRVVDVMAKSFNSSALNLENFKQSMKTVAPIANAANISLEQTTAMLGVLADSGLRGTRAATGLKNLMSQLTSPTSKLAQELGYTVNNSEGLSIAFDDLVKRNIDLAKATGLTDERSKAAFLTLLNGKSTVDELTESLNNANGTAQKQADIVEDTLSVSWDKFGSAVEGFVLREGEGFGEWLKGILNDWTEFINSLDEGYSLMKKIQKLDKEGGDIFQMSDEELEKERLELISMQSAARKVYQDKIKIYREEDEKWFSKYSYYEKQQIKGIAMQALEFSDAYSDRIDRINAEQMAREESAESNKEIDKEAITRIKEQQKDKEEAWAKDAKHFEEWSDKQVKARIAIRELDAEMIDNIGLREKALIDAAKEEKAEMMKTFAFQKMSADEKLLLEKQLDAKIANLEKEREDRIRKQQEKNEDDYDNHIKKMKKATESLVDAFSDGEVQTQSKLLSFLLGISDQDLERIQENINQAVELVSMFSDTVGMFSDQRLSSIQYENEIIMDDLNKRLENEAKMFDISHQHELDSFVGTEQQKADFAKQKSLERLEFEKQQEEERSKIRKKQLEEENRLGRQAFLADKANNIARAVQGTANAIIAALDNPFPLIQAGIIGALGAAQIATISATQYQPITFQDGGMIQGDSHANGGVPFTVAGRAGFEAEGGEYIFSRKTVNRLGVDFLDSLNFGESRQAPSMMFANGGVVPSVAQQGLNQAELADMIGEAVAMRISEIPVINVATETAQISRGILNAEAMATL